MYVACQSHECLADARNMHRIGFAAACTNLTMKLVISTPHGNVRTPGLARIAVPPIQTCGPERMYKCISSIHVSGSMNDCCSSP